LQDIQVGKGKRDDSVTEDENPEVTLEVCLCAPEGGRFHVRVMHQVAVPNEAEEKDENERCDESHETPFVIVIHGIGSIELH
jgi:hypothetical protein